MHPVGELQRIRLQLNQGQGQGDKGLKVHAGAGQAENNHKKTGHEGAGFSMTWLLTTKTSQQLHQQLQGFPE